MEIYLIFILFFSYFINVNTNYIFIPFDSTIYNPKNDILIQKDVITSTFSDDIYLDLNLGNPKQTIKVFLRLDQYELRIKEPNYISSLSNSFRNHLISNSKIICKENFYFITLNSLEDLNTFIHSDKPDKNVKEKKLIKEYKNINFVYLNDTTNNRYLEHELLEYELNKLIKYNYGMLGLRNTNIKYGNNPQFIDALKEVKVINNSIFSFIFNKDKNEEHLGYLIIGDKFIDREREYEDINKTNYAPRRGSLSWDLDIETIYSESKSDNLNSFFERNIAAKLRVELSYILGSKYYKDFIEKEFFNELVDKKVCEYKEVKIDLCYGTYVCNGKSDLFWDYYNNKFPDLVFLVKNIDDKLILTKEDLFFKNPNDKSDTNIYFRVYFHIIITTTWELGRTFLKKYRFSFDYGENLIYYHKSKIIDNINKNTAIDEKNNSQIFKIFLVVLFCLIIFVLGILFHKSIIKIPRKIKANELEDEYHYQNEEKDKKLNNDLDINNENNIGNEKSLYMELGTKNN